MNLVLRLIPAFLLALLLPSSSGVAHANVFRIVTQARNATVSNGVVSAGASLYDGDTLATNAESELTLHAASSMIHLGKRSRVTLRSASGPRQVRAIHSQRRHRDVRNSASCHRRDSCRSGRHSSYDASPLVRANYNHYSVVV